MKTSYIIYTKNSEKEIEDYIKQFMKDWEDDGDELIIVDDMSTDNTVPIIVNLIGFYFEDEEHFKFYINTSKKGKTKSIKMAKKIATNRHKVIIGGNNDTSK